MTTRKDILLLNDEVLEQAAGGVGTDYTVLKTQCNIIFSMATSAILMFLKAIQPSFDYSDKGANFMSLIHEWAEYHFHVDGKKESDNKAVAIRLVLEQNGFDVNGIAKILDETAAEVL